MSDKMINNKMYLSLSIEITPAAAYWSTCWACGRDQPAREPKGKTLPGLALRCSGARTVFALSADHLLDSQRGGAAVNSQLRHRMALRRVASSRHTSDAVSGEVMGGSSFMIVRSRVSVSGSKLLCPAVVMK